MLGFRSSASLECVLAPRNSFGINCQALCPLSRAANPNDFSLLYPRIIQPPKQHLDKLSSNQLPL